MSAGGGGRSRSRSRRGSGAEKVPADVKDPNPIHLLQLSHCLGVGFGLGAGAGVGARVGVGVGVGAGRRRSSSICEIQSADYVRPFGTSPYSSDDEEEINSANDMQTTDADDDILASLAAADHAMTGSSAAAAATIRTRSRSRSKSRGCSRPRAPSEPTSPTTTETPVPVVPATTSTSHSHSTFTSNAISQQRQHPEQKEEEEVGVVAAPRPPLHPGVMAAKCISRRRSCSAVESPVIHALKLGLDSPRGQQPMREKQRRNSSNAFLDHQQQEMLKQLNQAVEGSNADSASGRGHHGVAAQPVFSAAEPRVDTCLAHIAEHVCHLMKHNEQEELRTGVRKKSEFDLGNFSKRGLMRTTARSVTQVLVWLFEVLQIEPQCSVVTAIYLHRILDRGVVLTKRNFESLLLACTLLASKVWDDLSTVNEDFCTVLPHFSLLRINRLEQKFIGRLGWSCHVTRQQYTEVYFDLANPTCLSSVNEDLDDCGCLLARVPKPKAAMTRR